jgi:pimeloyl-ACP methyl ester carboxylesterase
MAHVTADPQSDSLVTLGDGRSLAYAEWGDANGRPVVLLHGTPGSRLLCPDEDATASAGVRLITIDRPGYGRSDPDPRQTLLSWADDYAEFHKRVALPPCPIVGWSAGGPYALASAVRTPSLVSSVGLAASSPPVEAMDDFWDEDRRRAELLQVDRTAAIEEARTLFQGYVADPWSIFASMHDPADPDARLLAMPHVKRAVIRMMREGARQGSVGAVADDMALLGPWGFSAADVTQEVGVWLGSENAACRSAADYYAATIPHATYVTFAGEGHLVPMARWADMLAWVR